MISSYVLEFSVATGSPRHAHAHAYPDVDAILSRVPQAFGVAGGRVDRHHLGLVFFPATIGVWVVQRGRFSQFVDLRPFVTFAIPGGASVRLDDADGLAALRADVDRDASLAVALAVDARAIRAALPTLRPALLRQNESLECDFDHALKPATGSCLAHGEFEYGSWNVETGAALAPYDPDA